MQFPQFGIVSTHLAAVVPEGLIKHALTYSFQRGSQTKRFLDATEQQNTSQNVVGQIDQSNHHHEGDKGGRGGGGVYVL
jgi:hypothetical protein